MQKIQKIHASLGLFSDLSATPAAPDGCVLYELQCATHEEIKKLIMASPTKSCGLDPVPTWLLKNLSASVVPILTELVNISLRDGVVPAQLKVAYVHPLLKRSGLDANNMKNYRPISNLSFVSKLLERVFSARLLAHMDRFSLHEPLQSAYKAYHSVETAMTRIQNDILCALDNQQVVILVLLDLSSAFDTVDHTILLQRLSRGLGISGTALKWFCSYLHGRKQTVLIGDSHLTT